MSFVASVMQSNPLVLFKIFFRALFGALLFSTFSAQAYISDRSNFGMYEEYLMSSAGTAYLGSAGNVTLNPAGLGFIRDVERYHTVLLVASFKDDSGSRVDNGVSFIPAFVAKNFSLGGGVIQPYFSSFEFSANFESSEALKQSMTTSEVKSYRAGMGWGKSWGSFALGLTGYLESSSSMINFYEDNQTPGESYFINLQADSQTYIMGASLGLAQQLSGWSWGLKLSPPPALISSREKTRGTYYDVTSGTRQNLNDASGGPSLRVPTATGGLMFDVSSDLHLLADVSYVFPAKGKDDINEVDYTGALTIKMGLKKDLNDRQNLYLGAGLEGQNTDRKSGVHEVVDLALSGGLKHQIKTSHALYGLSYRQSESGDSRTYVLIFGSDFSL